ncbi:F-box/FBD/LRR-repeat protein At1g13570-like [Bidens hawaiensis]|uniref:F-box/FBD/LRR-repeat protein At1g13570-like n=1 Tax=Bidens hawaiensis TaxID=980011 RepID=UPI0040497E65
MEPIHTRHKFEPEDFISSMPDNVLTNILDRLPLQDAVRTGILARKWRILHQLRGAITKCVLSLVDDEFGVEEEDVIHWISFLSGKGINDFTLEYVCEPPFKLPTHLFSCLELKHLKLYDCCLNPPPTFHGFPNLLSLELDEANGELGGVITRCPLLEILKLGSIYNSCKLKLDEIARLENLKILSLSLRTLDTTMNFSSSSTIVELLGSLPELQELPVYPEFCLQYMYFRYRYPLIPP